MFHYLSTVLRDNFISFWSYRFIQTFVFKVNYLSQEHKEAKWGQMTRNLLSMMLEIHLQIEMDFSVKSRKSGKTIEMWRLWCDVTLEEIRNMTYVGLSY